MARLLHIGVYMAIALAMGCSHARIAAVSNARDQGEEIRTKYHYRIFWDGAWKNDEAWRRAVMCNVHLYESYQPNVFSADGIPIALAFSDGLKEDEDYNTLNGLLSLFTFYVFPMFTDAHSHRNCEVTIGGRHVASVKVCFKKDCVESLLFPLPLLFYNDGDGDTCISGGRKFTLRGSDSSLRHSFGEVIGKAMAYGIASGLKEAEDVGKINEQLATFARSAQSLDEAATTRTKAASEDLARRGITLPCEKTRVGQPFEIVRCDREKGKDFAYSFALRKSGGSAMTIADLGDMRSAFRSAIRVHYASSHSGVNPRALVVDFTKYELKNGVVVGRVVVLTISPESLSYDPASRRGVLKVRIGEGQFEDARRWIRRNLVSVVSESNAGVGGNVVPKGASFYSLSEEMRDGVLEVSFKTE